MLTAVMYITVHFLFLISYLLTLFFLNQSTYDVQSCLLGYTAV
jgi:hypothetical protein